MKTAICQHCSKQFNITPGSYGKFCSLSCGTTFRNVINLEKAKEKYKRNLTKCKCCQIEMEYEKRGNTYCSISCASSVTNYSVPRKRGPTAVEKLPYSKIRFILCTHTNQYYSNKNSDGTVRRSSPYVKNQKQKYYQDARFMFNVYHYPKEFDIDLINQLGWYTCPGLKRKGQLKNTLGVSRDHIISVIYGFINNIDPKLISHPANCQIIPHSQNKKKHTKCNMSVSELEEKIKQWNKKYTEQATGIEPVTNSLEG